MTEKAQFDQMKSSTSGKQGGKDSKITEEEDYAYRGKMLRDEKKNITLYKDRVPEMYKSDIRPGIAYFGIVFVEKPCFTVITLQGIDPHSGSLIVSDKASNISEDGSGITNTTKCKELQVEISQLTKLQGKTFEKDLIFDYDHCPWLVCRKPLGLKDDNVEKFVDLCTHLLYMTKNFNKKRIELHTLSITEKFLPPLHPFRQEKHKRTGWFLSMKLSFREWFALIKERNPKNYLEVVHNTIGTLDRVLLDREKDQQLDSSLSNTQTPSITNVPIYCSRQEFCKFGKSCKNKHSQYVCKHLVSYDPKASKKQPCNFTLMEEYVIMDPELEKRIPGWKIIPRVKEKEYARDLLLIPTLHCTNEVLLRIQWFWKSLFTLLAYLKDLTKMEIGGVVESVAVNFGGWETATSLDSRSPNCHAHVHLVLSVQGQDLLSLQPGWEALLGKTDGINDHLAQDVDDLKVAFSFEQVSSLSRQMTDLTKEVKEIGNTMKEILNQVKKNSAKIPVKPKKPQKKPDKASSKSIIFPK